MKNKIFRNREVLRGIKFDVVLSNQHHQFKILHVGNKGIKVAKTITYSEMDTASSNSLEGIVKQMILENSVNRILPLSRKAFMSKIKLEKVPIIIDDVKFNLNHITNSSVTLEKFIEYDELLGCNEDGFIGIVNHVVMDNLMDNPPEIAGSNCYKPKLFVNDLYVDAMHFQKIGPVRKVVSERELERNREKNKKINEEERKKLRKMEELEKELNLDKKSHTRDLARHR